MADKKISQLTAASTPLAGTEVLPIVQSSSTVKVAVSDLTAGRVVTLGSGSKVYQVGNSGNNYLEGQLNVGGTSSAVGGQFAYAAQSSGYVSLVNLNNSGGDNARIYIGYGATTTGLPANPVAYFTQTGNLTISTAAKGVNFTANTPAAGMTSQLLNWYEEGSYTATLTSVGGGSITVSTSFDTLGYTRIGRMVYVHGYITASSVSTPTGELRLNVPFNTCAVTQVGERGSWGSGGINISGSASSVANGFQIGWSDNKSYVTIFLVTGNAVADAAAQIQGGSNTDIRVGFWYPCVA